MNPKRIILVRHGQSEGNVDKSKYANVPDFALNLTEEGIRQAFHAGREIKEIIGQGSVHVYLSPFYRTRQTYAQIAKSIEGSVIKLFEDPRLREQDWGHFRHPEAGEEIDQERDKYGAFYYRIPDGESCADVYDRVSTFLDTLYRDFAKPDYPDNTLIVTHGMTLRLFLMRWFHWKVEVFDNLQNPRNCQVVIMQKDGKDRYNLISDLAKRDKTA